MRREQFAGVGSEQSFSQTNSNEASASVIDKENLHAKRISARRLAKIKKPKIIRFAVHIAVLAAIVFIVGVGKMSASQALVGYGGGSTKNQTSLITTGAMLAADTNSVIKQDVNKKAQDLTNLSSLTTAGDNFLAKKSPVLIAGQNRDISTYKVKEGDTLSSLSQKFNITTDTIKWTNNISDENQIKPGAELTILPVSGILYTFQDGDDLLAIAQRYQSNASLIENFNQLEGKAPNVGAKLVIPDGVMPAPSIPVPTTKIGTQTTAFTTGFSGGGSIGNSYSYGFCTWYVASRRPIPGNWGNAINWLGAARASGYGTGRTPQVGAVAWGPGNHVAYVESVNGDGTVTVSEMNYWGGGGGWGRRSYRTTSAGTFQYIY